MRLIWSIISLLLCICPAVAQDRMDGVVSAMQLVMQKAETSIVPSNTSIDNALDTLKMPKLHVPGRMQELDSSASVAMKIKVRVQDMRDSIGRAIQAPVDSMSKINRRIRSKTDTLLRQINAPIDDVNSRVLKKEEAVQSKYNNVVGSIHRNVPAEEHELNTSLDEAKAGQLISGKLAGQSATLPAIEIPHNDVTLPDILNPHPAAVPTLEMPKTTQTLSDLDLKQTDPSRKLDLDVAAAKNVTEVTGTVYDMQDQLAEVQKHGEELQSIRENSLPVTEKLSSEVEDRVERLDEMKALGEADNKVSEHYNVVQRYNDKKLLEQEIRRKASNIANDYLIKKAPLIKQGVETLNKGKSFLAKFGEAKGILKNQPSELQTKKLHQRLVPALTTQVHGMEGVSIDFALQLGYRVTSRLTTGIGGIARASLGKQHQNFLGYGGVYGGRTYAEFGLVKGLFTYVDFEALRAQLTAVKPITSETMESMSWAATWAGQALQFKPKYQRFLAGIAQSGVQRKTGRCQPSHDTHGI